MGHDEPDGNWDSALDGGGEERDGVRRSDRAPSKRHDGSQLRAMILVGAVAIVILPILWFAIPGEVARWYSASADQAALEQRWDDAIAKIDTAIAWDSDDDLLRIRLADVQYQAGKITAATETLTGLLGRDSDARTLPPELRLAVMQKRSMGWQRLGRHAEAITDLTEVVESRRKDFDAWSNAVARDDLAMALNNRAYAYALANRDLELGLNDINEAFRVLGHEDEYVYLDTRGYLRYLNGDLTNAMPDMDVATQLAELDFERFRQLTNELKSQVADTQFIDRQTRVKEEEMSVIYQHRGLVRKALGQTELGEVDLKRAKQLGYNPENGVW